MAGKHKDQAYSVRLEQRATCNDTVPHVEQPQPSTTGKVLGKDGYIQFKFLLQDTLEMTFDPSAHGAQSKGWFTMKMGFSPIFTHHCVDGGSDDIF